MFQRIKAWPKAFKWFLLFLIVLAVLAVEVIIGFKFFAKPKQEMMFCEFMSLELMATQPPQHELKR